MQTSFIHDVLKQRSHKANWVYIGSILMVNKHVPMFDERYGLDYDWLLNVTKYRRCKEVDEPTVVRFMDGENLSLDPEYRKNDFYEGLRIADGDLKVMKRWFDTRAKYHYMVGDVKMARFLFARGTMDIKGMAYYLTSYIPFLRKYVIKKFNVFG